MRIVAVSAPRRLRLRIRRVEKNGNPYSRRFHVSDLVVDVIAPSRPGDALDVIRAGDYIILGPGEKVSFERGNRA